MPARVSGTRLGRLGEATAADYLEREGYTILERNYRAYGREIDIVARRGRVLVFVEVKRWESLGIEGLEHSIDRRKQRRIIEASKAYLKERAKGDLSVRYDILFLCRGGQEIRHIADAFVEHA